MAEGVVADVVVGPDPSGSPAYSGAKEESLYLSPSDIL